MKKLISYIFPIYNEEGNIPFLYKTMESVTKKVINKYDIEYIFVNDGSKDKSFELLSKIADKDKRVRIIDFARNFGHQIAVTAGLDNSKGDAVIIMDSDMQDPPEVSLELIKKWEEGYDVAYAQRRTRQDSFFKKFTAAAFYRILDKLADVKIPKDTGDFRLMDRKVVDVLNSYREKNRFLRGMVSSLGFKQIAVLFDRHERYAGTTGYPLKKMIKLANDGIFSFSSFPIRFIMSFAIVLGVFSLICLLFALITRLCGADWFTAHFTFLIISVIMFFSAIQTFFIALVGEYVYRIYAEAQGRPLYIINKIYGKNQNTNS